MNIRITKVVEPTYTVDEIMQHIKSNIVASQDGYGNTGNTFIGSINDAAQALWNDGAKIKAIKLIRTIYPMGLAVAKEYCESKFNHAKLFPQ